MSSAPQFIIVSKALFHHSLPVFLRNFSELALVDVA
jgi:hypothetical protein